MKMKILSASIAAAFLMAGCGSNDAQEVAYAMCELAKTGDVQGMKKYAEPEFAQALEQVDVMLQAALATDFGKSEFEKNIALLKDVNCKETTKIADIDATTKSVSNHKTSQVFVLKRINDEWKVAAE
ncbi:MAG: DUF4878 domain-containing protein [Thiovulaceae bacterium]|nr:DUF4878 domain-containing protein [Sulfurimonadaceae bacterium]MDD3817013.1 DUF4878 domain-containing protein [Sulfurimonadaceae bacterium]